MCPSSIGTTTHAKIRKSPPLRRRDAAACTRAKAAAMSDSDNDAPEEVSLGTVRQQNTRPARLRRAPAPPLLLRRQA
jgi:hypothetical protein